MEIKGKNINKLITRGGRVNSINSKNSQYFTRFKSKLYNDDLI